MMRARAIGIFCLGFLSGAILIYYVLWRTGGLVPGRLLTLTTHELASGVLPTPRPLATIPFPTPTGLLGPAGTEALASSLASQKRSGL